MKHHKALWLVDEPGIVTTDPDDLNPKIELQDDDNIVGHALKNTEVNEKLWNGIMLNSNVKIPRETVSSILELVGG